MDIWPKLQNFRTKYPSFRKSASVACGPNFRIPSSEDWTSWNDLKMSLSMTYEFTWFHIWTQMILWIHDNLVMKQGQATKRIPLTALVLEVAWKRIPKTSKNIGREMKRNMEGHSHVSKLESFCISPKLIRSARDYSKCPSNLLEIPERFKRSRLLNTNQRQLFETLNVCFFRQHTHCLFEQKVAVPLFLPLNGPSIFPVPSLQLWFAFFNENIHPSSTWSPWFSIAKLLFEADGSRR